MSKPCDVSTRSGGQSGSVGLLVPKQLVLVIDAVVATALDDSEVQHTSGKATEA